MTRIARLSGPEVESRLALLSEEYEQFRFHLPDALIEIELPSLRVTYMNKLATALLGYDVGDVVLGIRGLDLLDEESGKRALSISEAHFASTVRRGKPYERQRGQTTYEFTMIRKDGTRFPVETQSSYILDRCSTPVGVRFMFREITDRVSAAEQTRASNQMLTALAQAQTDFIREGDTPAVFSALLESLLELSGSTFGFIAEVREGSPGLPVLRTLAIADGSERRDGGLEFDSLGSLFGRVLVTGERIISNDLETDGHREILPGFPPVGSLMGVPIHAGGRLIGLVALANRAGGYEPAQAEFIQPFLTTCGTIIEAHRTDRARIAAEERLERALRGGDLALWDWHVASGRVDATAGPTTGALVGLTGETTIDRLRKSIHPEDRGAVDSAFTEVLIGRSPAIECEFRYQMATGDIGWVLARGTVVERDAHGAPVRMAGSFQNITSRKAAELERHRLELQMRQSQKLESLGVFAGGIAHDFNNMLTAVLGNIHLLQRSLTEPGQHELATEATRAAERGAELVRRLLTYARPEVDSPELIPLETLIEETAALARSMLTPQVRLTVRHSREGGLVAGSKTALEQILVNLVMNAGDAMPRGGKIRLAHRVTTVGPRHRWAPPELAEGRYHVVTVSDTGTGIAPEMMELIFDPFFTTKEVGQGTGLGLPTALSIARAHGGWLSAESTPGRGSTFRLLLPFVEG